MTRSRPVLDRRQLVLGGAAMLAACSAARPQPQRMFRILFVCEHGSVKSPIAREHFRRIAAQRGLAVRAVSRGINPLEDVSAALAVALAADGIDPRCDPLTRLSRADLSEADVVATFNPIPEALTHGLILDLRSWFDVPGMNDNYGAARPVLLAHLEGLADELARRAG